MMPEDSVIPSAVVIAVVLAAGVLPGVYGAAATVLLLALVVLGTFSVYLRLAEGLGSRVAAAAIAVAIPAGSVALEVTRGGWWQWLAFAVALVYAWLAVEQVLIWVDDRRRPRSGGEAWPAGDRAGQPSGFAAPCPTGKVKFASAYEAERAVSSSLQRHLDGTSDYEEPLRSSYCCDQCGWWHVTRQA